MVLIRIFLITNDVDYLFICLCHLDLLFSEIFVQIFCLFLKLVISLQLSFESLYILNTNPFSDI